MHLEMSENALRAHEGWQQADIATGAQREEDCSSGAGAGGGSIATQASPKAQSACAYDTKHRIDFSTHAGGRPDAQQGRPRTADAARGACRRPVTCNVQVGCCATIMSCTVKERQEFRVH